MSMLMILTKFLLLVVPSLISVAFITLLERKILSLVGVRVGPNKVSLYGFLQPITDAVKLSNKQINFLFGFSFIFYYISSGLMLISAIMLWFCLPSEPLVYSFKFSVLILMIILGLNSLNSIVSGWSSFGKYPLLGSLRTVSQLISYEASLYLCFFLIIFQYFSFSFFNFNFYTMNILMFLMPFCFYIWIPSMLSELNRTPYDFSEGESELVSGFNTDFGSSAFTLIFLSEYSNIIFFSVLSSFLFFLDFFYFFFLMVFIFVIWIRSVLPRFRFDKLMMLSWKFFIPFLTLMLLFLPMNSF